MNKYQHFSKSVENIKIKNNYFNNIKEEDKSIISGHFKEGNNKELLIKIFGKDRYENFSNLKTDNNIINSEVKKSCKDKELNASQDSSSIQDNIIQYKNKVNNISLNNNQSISININSSINDLNKNSENINNSIIKSNSTFFNNNSSIKNNKDITSLESNSNSHIKNDNDKLNKEHEINLIQFIDTKVPKDKIISKLKTLEVIKEFNNGFFGACGSKNNLYIFNDILEIFEVIKNYNKNEEYFNFGEINEFNKNDYKSLKILYVV